MNEDFTCLNCNGHRFWIVFLYPDGAQWEATCAGCGATYALLADPTDGTYTMVAKTP